MTKTKLYRVFVTSTAMPLETVTSTAMPLETVSAKDHADAIAQVKAMYPARDEALTAILIKIIKVEPPKLEQ